MILALGEKLKGVHFMSTMYEDVDMELSLIHI